MNYNLAPIIVKSAQVVFEDKPLLRVVELSGLVLNFELTQAQLRLLAAQAVREALKDSPPNAHAGRLPPLTGEENGA